MIAPSETSILDLDLPFAVPGEILVRFVSGGSRADAEALASSYGVTLRWVTPSDPDLAVVQIPLGFYTEDFMVAFQAEPIVSYVERNGYVCFGGGR